ncbi:uncharacterized protein IL334_006596 [Kwoniella shivajii]|uniref:Solute carrier family 35 (UDP-xylose/UDP-N-acetylglucosamine transporter), member B4 n=1 Tax=Kwoniella shivajii TaxID=564305 RepID=A0ABZ1D6E0_9TREE|nr:hypothetical protein IL334_006596 [Kwoniella shivajii]
MVDRSFISALAQSTAGEWGLVLSLVFGGCCSNVWALEGVLKSHPKSGTFLTFVQFLYVTITTLSSQLTWKRIPKSSIPYPVLKSRKVPLGRWGVQVILFLAVSLMNNYAFGLKIPVTVHIIFRSGGLCISMLVGWLFAKRRYSVGQMFAALLITSGIVLATASAPRRRSVPSSSPSAQVSAQSANTAHTSPWIPEHLEYFAGVGLLAFAMFVSAFLGLWQEQTYRMYGREWKEALFYGHALSLPFFLPFQTSLKSTYRSFASSPPVSLFNLPIPATYSSSDNPIKNILGEYVDLLVPSALLGLALNIITQGICVRGVNRLTAKVNSVTVNLILTVRKAVSLAISVWWFGSGFNRGLAIGGGMVLFGTVLYSFAPGPEEVTSAPPKVRVSPKSNGINSRINEQEHTKLLASSGTDIGSNSQPGIRRRHSDVKG